MPDGGRVTAGVLYDRVIRGQPQRGKVALGRASCGAFAALHLVAHPTQTTGDVRGGLVWAFGGGGAWSPLLVVKVMAAPPYWAGPPGGGGLWWWVRRCCVRGEISWQFRGLGLEQSLWVLVNIALDVEVG